MVTPLSDTLLTCGPTRKIIDTFIVNNVMICEKIEFRMPAYVDIQLSKWNLC